ncbi:SDR family oxidoreductase [Azohydromonas lata]|uniref:SDR family NAD(P)-dependent oxidoreductase n=1 Tax=Azohydromonas lata TaxID=45677 RepID=A0ABU5IL93_9BURK|nr:SDR family NAD(P)-dependent oxidoreductase [Azohydromonas lata]MDZ5459665.1 SDR family NAD(P)-dependent oxidoreductase [Azohydromonas lata]
MSPAARVVLITGAAGHLGRAVARHFMEAGDRLVLVDLDAQALREAFGEDGGQRLLAAADLLRPGAMEGVVRQALERFGRIDVLCNLAGGFRMGPAVHELAEADWDALLDLNARTVLHAVRAVVPHMLERGSGKVVNVGAHSAQRGVAQMGAYTASKSVVMRLTEAMAGELRGRGINVNCVLPSIIDTPDNRRDMPQADPSLWVAPADLAQVMGFLASDAARAVHGACVPVTGLS